MASVCTTTTVYFDPDTEMSLALEFENRNPGWFKEVNTIWIKFTKHETAAFEITAIGANHES